MSNGLCSDGDDVNNLKFYSILSTVIQN